MSKGLLKKNMITEYSSNFGVKDKNVLYWNALVDLWMVFHHG